MRAVIYGVWVQPGDVSISGPKRHDKARLSTAATFRRLRFLVDGHARWPRILDTGNWTHNDGKIIRRRKRTAEAVGIRCPRVQEESPVERWVNAVSRGHFRAPLKCRGLVNIRYVVFSRL